MSRYIDADIATYLMIQWADRETNDDIRHGYHNCLVIMNDMPTAYVRENVKGEWEMINEQLAKCSVCGGYESTNGKDRTMTGVIFKTQKKYCPHCGARMVEE